jgi:hypothetical protein
MRGVMPDHESVILLIGKVRMCKTAYERNVPNLNNERMRLRWTDDNS